MGTCVFRSYDVCRGVVRNEFQANDLPKTAVSYWLAVARTHDKMAEFKRHNFKNHPAMANEMIHFMMASAHSDGVLSFDTKLNSIQKEIEEKIDEATKEIKEAAVVAEEEINDKLAKLWERVDESANEEEFSITSLTSSANSIASVSSSSALEDSITSVSSSAEEDLNNHQ